MVFYYYYYSGPSEYTEILKNSNGKLFIWMRNMENNLIVLMMKIFHLMYDDGKKLMSIIDLIKKWPGVRDASGWDWEEARGICCKWITEQRPRELQFRAALLALDSINRKSSSLPYSMTFVYSCWIRNLIFPGTSLRDPLLQCKRIGRMWRATWFFRSSSWL